jgi:hypothetical protein
MLERLEALRAQHQVAAMRVDAAFKAAAAAIEAFEQSGKELDQAAAVLARRLGKPRPEPFDVRAQIAARLRDHDVFGAILGLVGRRADTLLERAEKG